MSPKSPWRILTAVLLAFALVAAACGDDEEDAPAAPEPAPAAPAEEPAEEPMDEPEEPAEEAMEEPAEEPAEEAMEEPAEEPMEMAPLKIGLIAQVEELMAFPEVPAVA
ncbi:MAG: hypothetical protein F4Z54_06445, partial [Acidimicrobiaceae bacterium]|nr:hypothetical protein [Acidimicrobiaceae bacterium]